MDLLRESKMFNKTFGIIILHLVIINLKLGENVIRHYSNAASVEITEFSKYVTDWEIKRGFDRC